METPSTKNNIFKGENAYDQETGFLHKSNFSTSERKEIVQKSYKSNNGGTISDLVTLLSSEEYQVLCDSKNIFLMQIPTTSAISKSDYQSNILESGRQYPIWTRDSLDNPYATHAVKVIAESSNPLAVPASSGRSGVMPMMTFNHQLLQAHLIKGEGTGESPYVFKISHSFSLPMIGVVSIVILIVGGVVLFMGRSIIHKKIVALQ